MYSIWERKSPLFAGNFSGGDAVGFLQCSQGFRRKARFLYCERQTLMKKDLMKKYMHCFGNGKTKRVQDILDRNLDVGFKAYMQCSCFSHANYLRSEKNFPQYFYF